MRGEVRRYRFENAFFVENPPHGRFELVTFVIQDIEGLDDSGRYQAAQGRASSGRIFFGVDEQRNEMIYHQCPPASHGPGGVFVLVPGAVVYKNWSQFPRSGANLDCIE